MLSQTQIDSLKGELREQKELVEALEKSRADAERLLSKKINELASVRRKLSEARAPVQGHQSDTRTDDGPLGDGPSFTHDVKPLEEELALAKTHPEYGIDVEAVEAALREARADAAGEAGKIGG
jgi:hypothetical protein